MKLSSATDHPVIVRLIALMNAKESTKKQTKALGSVTHEELCNAFRYWINESKGVFRETVTVRNIQGLGDEGVDLAIDFEESKLNAGIQVKSNFDIQEKDFTRKVHAQISRSHKHSLVKLIVAFGGDMSDRSREERVRRLESDLHQNKDDGRYVFTLSPERVATIYQAYKNRSKPSSLIENYDLTSDSESMHSIDEKQQLSVSGLEDPKPFDSAGLNALLDEYGSIPAVDTRKLIFSRISESTRNIIPPTKWDAEMTKLAERILHIFDNESDKELAEDWVPIIRMIASWGPPPVLKAIKKRVGKKLRTFGRKPSRYVSDVVAIISMMDNYSKSSVTSLLKLGIDSWSDDAYRILLGHLDMCRVEKKYPGFLGDLRKEILERHASSGQNKTLQKRLEDLLNTIEKDQEILKTQSNK